MRDRIIYLFFLLIGFCSSCSGSEKSVVVGKDSIKITADTTINVSVNGGKCYQTIDGFGASDAWTINYIGKYWNTPAKEGIAKLLFSQNIQSGIPDGIGLSMWRVNIGGGTAEQGSASGISDKTRRAECFLDAGGSYDWTKQQGQQYFMQQAKGHGCNNFVFFSNTPPVYYTENGLGYSNRGAYSNLKDDCYGKFADFLSTVANHFIQEGYNVSYISPVNEPQWNWSSGQEGSGWQNAEVAKLARALDQSLTNNGLNNVKMLLAEAGAWNYLYEADGSVGVGRSDIINDFFNPESNDYIGNLSHMPKLICSHSYWTDLNWNTLYNVRSKVYAAAKQYNLKVYQSEWCMMGNGYEDCPNYTNASYMDIALAMSKVIYHDLVTANASSWSFWTSCAQEEGQKSRYYLIRIIPSDGDYGDIVNSGTYMASKNLWTLGNYSLFVRPGYQRIDLEINNQTNTFFGSAYISPSKDKLIVVYTNTRNKSIKVQTDIESLGKRVVSFKQYTTSSTKNLEEESDEQKGIIPAKSVVTFVYNLN
jgi:O-glycosyl hydrolase